RAAKSERHLARRGIPDLHVGGIVQQNDLLAVRAERGETDAAAVAFQRDDRLARVDVPDAGGAVVAFDAVAVIGGQDALAVRAPHGAGDAILVALQSLAELAGFGVPKVGLAVLETIGAAGGLSPLEVECAGLLAAVF